MVSELSRVNILGVGVTALSMESALQESELLLSQGRKGYVCVTGVHGIMEAQRDQQFRDILNDSLLTTPDGMPTVWLGKFHGYEQMSRVYGPDFMLGLCERSVTRGYRHFLYGGKEGVAEELKAELLKRFPGLQIVGTYTPPFRPLNSAEEKALHKQLEALQVDVFWCGLSTPKQERFMAKYHKVLPVKLMVGVGAAFDLLSGNLEESPDWMKNAGLQWLFRLVKEPKRLWRRYLFNNPRFLWYTFLQLTHLKSYQLAAKGSAQSCRPVHPSTRIGSRAGAFVMPSPQERTFVPMHVRTSTSTASITAMSEMARTRYSHSDSRVNHP